MGIIWVSWAAAFLYSLIAGFLAAPSGVQATLCSLLFLICAAFRVLPLKDRSRRLWAILVFAGLNSLAFALYSNQLVLMVAGLAVCFALAMLLIAGANNGELPPTGTEFWRLLGVYFISYFQKLFSPSHLKAFFGPLSLKLSWRPERSTIRAIIVLVPVCFIFHLLFASINNDYDAFMSFILDRIWLVLRYIVDLELIWETVIQAYLIHALLSVDLEGQKPEAAAPRSGVIRFTIVLIPVVLLFFVFSSFQGRFLLANLSSWPFKTLSLYTQQGFWELFFVAIIGYILWAATLVYEPENSERPGLLRSLLIAFTLELLAVVLFTAHKVAVLQAYFGLKDQRIFASAAVLLIGLTFALCLLRLIKLVSDQQIFCSQYLAFLMAAAVLSLSNIDLMITVTYPISYFHGNQRYKDYSYLLTNSFDNADEWMELIREAQSTGVPEPENYYWGRYAPLIERKGGICSAPLLTKLSQLKQKYSANGKTHSLPELLQTNLAERNALRVVNTNSAAIHHFIVNLGSQMSCVGISYSGPSF